MGSLTDSEVCYSDANGYFSLVQMLSFAGARFFAAPRSFRNCTISVQGAIPVAITRTSYALTTKLDVPYVEAIELVKEALLEEGFGVLTEIDVKATLKKKLNAEFRDYIILGACNPELANRALKMELGIGLLLPCNVIVYAEEDGSTVSVVDPITVLSITPNDAVSAVAEDANTHLERVMHALDRHSSKSGGGVIEGEDEDED